MVSKNVGVSHFLRLRAFCAKCVDVFFAMGWRTYLISVIIPTITSVVIVVSGITGPSIPSIVIHVCIVIPILIIPVVIPGVLGLTLHRSYIPHQQDPQFRPDRRHHTLQRYDVEANAPLLFTQLYSLIPRTSSDKSAYSTEMRVKTVHLTSRRTLYIYIYMQKCEIPGVFCLLYRSTNSKFDNCPISCYVLKLVWAWNTIDTGIPDVRFVPCRISNVSHASLSPCTLLLANLKLLQTKHTSTQTLSNIV
jgi:hypothetical protein